MSDIIVPGTSFESILRENLARGAVEEAKGYEQAWLEDRLQRHARGGETFVIRRGEAVWHQVTEYSTPGGGTLLICADISQLKSTQDALHASEQRFRDFAEAAADWLWETDAEHRFTFISERNPSVPGASSELELGNTREAQFLEGGGDPRLWESHAERLRAHKPFREFEFVQRFPDGGERTISMSGRPVFDDNGRFVGYRGASRDMSEQRAAQVALRESEALRRAIIDNSPNWVVLKDTEGRYLVLNRQFERTFGVSVDRAIGKTAQDLFAPGDSRAFLEHDAEVLETGRAVWREVQVQDASFTHLVVKFPTRTASGEITGVGAVGTDITERLRTAEERERLQGQLQQSQKMEALGQLSGGIAHDFNNILASILGYAGLAYEFCVDDPQSKLGRYLREIQHAGERARDLVAQMLMFSRGDEAESRPVQLAPLVTEVARMLRSSLPSSIEVATSTDDDLPAVRFHPMHLHQVVMNLCINARDAMDGKGALRSRCAIDPAST